MAAYLGSNPRLRAFFTKDWTRSDLTHAECASIWLKILSTIFCFPNDHPFQIKPQLVPPPLKYRYLTRPAASNGDSKVDPHSIWVLFDDEAIIAVVESRSSLSPANWSSIRGSAYTYISSLPKSHSPTIGIIAQGDKFICWEQTQEQCTLPRQLFPVRGEPASVVDDSVEVQTWFEEVRERAVKGGFAEN